MKKEFILTILSLLLFPFSSCKDNNDLPELPEECVTVHFGLNFIGMSDASTRSLASGYKYADGKSISVLKCYVYNQANGSNSAPIKEIDIDVKDVNGNKGGDISLQLPKNQNFDIIFIGTSIPQTPSTSKLYYNTTERTMTVNYSVGNDEELDCFYAVKKNVTTETALSDIVELRRPFAQLNIGTQDYVSYNANTPIKNIAVSVDGIYNKFNLMDGEVIGSPQKINFTAAAVPSGQVFPVADVSYLSMNYLLVNHRKLVDITMTVNHTSTATEANVIDIKNIAVERNYQTNVHGKLLLSGIITQ